MNDHTPRPVDLANFSLHELVDGYHVHIGALVNHEHGIGRPEPIGRLRASALDALAIGEQLIQRMRSDRWTTVRDALRLGGTVADVATALDLTPGEVAAGLRSWGDGQHQHGLMTTEQYSELYALLEEGR